MLRTPIEVIDDLDKLLETVEPEEVMVMFSAYSASDLEDWLFSFESSKIVCVRRKAVLVEVRALMMVSY